MAWFRPLQLIFDHFSSLNMTYVEISQPMVIMGLPWFQLIEVEIKPKKLC